MRSSGSEWASSQIHVVVEDLSWWEQPVPVSMQRDVVQYSLFLVLRNASMHPEFIAITSSMSLQRKVNVSVSNSCSLSQS